MPSADKNEQERQLDYPMGERVPQPGEALPMAGVDGLRWVRTQLPFALDHINLWALRDELDGRPGWTLVDCGITNETTRTQWEQVFATGLDGLPVLRLLVTHMHPDHIGLAHWLTRRWTSAEHECRMWISGTDFNAARIASQSTTGFGGEAAARFMASHGLSSPEAMDKIRQRSNYYSSMVPQVPERHRRLMDGDTVCTSIPGGTGPARWTALAGYGHAPEHISLHDAERGVLISGDMVLPRISTNVSVIDLEPEADPLALYLQSLARLRALPDETLVLPSHGRPFRGLRRRIDQLTAHHDERFAEVMRACRAAPQTAADLLPVLFRRPLDLHQTTFAMGESIAHLNALWHRGQLRRNRGADGVFRFSIA